MASIPQINAQELRILDVIRGQNFALERNNLQGDESEIFTRNYLRLVQRREQLLAEYDD